MESNIIAFNSFSWKDVNWDALRRLRTRFLSFGAETAKTGDYWRSTDELASYDFTFAERIGWKWDAVIAELKARGWMLPQGTILDYGCGTGVAGRRVIAGWPDAVRKLMLWDRSRAAIQFAQRRAATAFPGLAVETLDGDRAPEVMVISHVLNELNEEGLERLLALAATAQVVIWIEPGTAAVSRALIGVRNRMIGEGTEGTKGTQGMKRKDDRALAPFRPVAPCTHSLTCGLLTPENERHWCHHFAKVPAEIFQDPGWGRFAKTLEVDLRTIPFSYLVLDRRPIESPHGEGAVPAQETSGESRVIGHPRHYKGFDKVLSCQADGVHELILQKRDAPELYKEMKKDPGSLYRWDRENEKIRGGERIF